jgi:hypothetical protein
MCIKRKWMHIDRANEVAMAPKAAPAADPISSPGLVLVLASRTPARCSSFGAGRAQDAGLVRCMGEVIYVTAVFPLRHAAIVVAAAVPVAHAVRVADEERSHTVLDAKVDDPARGLMPEIAHAPLSPSTNLVLGPLELLEASGVLLAPAQLLGKLRELLAPLPLETTDAAPGDDERLAHSGGDSGQVDFPQVHGRLHQTGSPFRLLHFYTDVQLEAPVPDERAGSGVLGKGEGQNERRVAFAHRQNDAPLLTVDGLSGPLDWIEAILAPGILHTHLGMLPAQRTGRCDIGEKGVNDLLHSLSIEGEPAAFGSLFQLTLSRPFRMTRTRLLVHLHAAVPHAGRFLLRRFKATEAGGRQIGQAIHVNGLHTKLFSLSARKTEIRVLPAGSVVSISATEIGGFASRFGKYEGTYKCHTLKKSK